MPVLSTNCTPESLNFPEDTIMYSLFNNTISCSVYTASSGMMNRGKHVDRCEHRDCLWVLSCHVQMDCENHDTLQSW